MRQHFRHLSSCLAFVFAISLLIGSHSLFADTSTAKNDRAGARVPPSTPLAKMHETYKNAQTLTADFTQKQTNLSLGTTKETSGTIFIKRPNLFRWETKSPEKDASVLVSNGTKVWYYTPPFRKGEHGQVLVRPAADVQSRLAIDLLDGRADIKKDFKTKDLGNNRYELKPLKPAGDIEHIELFLEKPTNLVYRLILFHSTGNQTELALINVVLGPKLERSLFDFVAPESTEEIH